MVPESVSLIAFLVLIVWWLVFTALRRPLARRIAKRNQPHNSFSEQHLDRIDRDGAVVIQDNRFENTSNGVHAVKREDRAKTYLRRIVALTGATQMDNSYVLDVGTTQFRVRDGYVGRLRDTTDPNCIYRETCFYSAHRGMPKAEQIAAALLQLKNNPALFDKWVAQSGLMFKADGTTVQRGALIGWR
jgi:hypothetical protein